MTVPIPAHAAALPLAGLPHWHPSQGQRWLLRAAAGAESGARQAWARFLPGAPDPERLDAASRLLLPLLHRRRQLLGLDGRWARAALTWYLLTWRQNRRAVDGVTPGLRRLREAGIPVLLLKGAALTDRYYPDRGTRPMGDLDLMVPGEAAPAAAAELGAAGWRPLGGLDVRRLPRTQAAVHAWHFEHPTGPDLDLHWYPSHHCCDDRISRLLFDGAGPARFGCEPVLVPAPEDLLFLVCVHGMHWNDPPALRWVADALRILAALPAPSWDRLRVLAAASAQRAALAQALSCLGECFDAGCDATQVERLAVEAPAWERRELDLRLGSHPLGLRAALRYHGYRRRRWREGRRAVGRRDRLRPGDYWLGLAEAAGAAGAAGLPGFALSKLRRRL